MPPFALQHNPHANRLSDHAGGQNEAHRNRQELTVPSPPYTAPAPNGLTQRRVDQVRLGHGFSRYAIRATRSRRLSTRFSTTPAMVTPMATTTTVIVASALISGVTPSLILDQIRIYRVVFPGPVTKFKMITSSREIVNAKSQPDRNAGEMTGGVMLRNICPSFDLGSTAASSMDTSASTSATLMSKRRSNSRNSALPIERRKSPCFPDAQRSFPASARRGGVICRIGASPHAMRNNRACISDHRIRRRRPPGDRHS